MHQIIGFQELCFRAGQRYGGRYQAEKIWLLQNGGCNKNHQLGRSVSSLAVQLFLCPLS